MAIKVLNARLMRYGGHSKLDPGMKKYDGVGYAPVKQNPAAGTMSSLQKGGWPVVCNDSRTSALFIAEPFDLASGGFDTPYYMREMSILEKIKRRARDTDRNDHKTVHRLGEG